MFVNRNRPFLRYVVDNESGEGGGGDGQEQGQQGEQQGGDGALGDAGKKALDAMKAERNTARQELRDVRAQLAELQAQVEAQGRPPEEQALEAARREAREAAMQEANARLVAAEIRAAAAGKLNDPQDALRLLDLSSFDVAGDGTIDAEAIGEAIDDLVKKKPYLAPQRAGFGGSADGGTRNADASGGKGQLSREELAGMSPEAIMKAKSEGRLNRLLGISAP